uniref:RNase H type-1 domain-containing protein n=1 Tax=Davidia involucrata TaxID=16924 RepID=A0A5B7AEW9_DAVIN
MAQTPALEYGVALDPQEGEVLHLGSSSSGPSLLGPSSWEPPPLPGLKLNVDGSWNAASGSGGIGALVRIQYAGSALHMESLTIAEGLHFCLEMGCRRTIIESDNASLIGWLRKGADFSFNLEVVLMDIISSACEVEVSQFCYVRRGVTKQPMNWLKGVVW